MTSLQIQKLLALNVTEKMLEHELFRFCSMDVDALEKRINKIKSAKKLEAFRQMAKIVNEKRLARLARKRRNELFQFETNYFN